MIARSKNVVVGLKPPFRLSETALTERTSAFIHDTPLARPSSFAIVGVSALVGVSGCIFPLLAIASSAQSRRDPVLWLVMLVSAAFVVAMLWSRLKPVAASRHLLRTPDGTLLIRAFDSAGRLLWQHTDSGETAIIRLHSASSSVTAWSGSAVVLWLHDEPFCLAALSYSEEAADFAAGLPAWLSQIPVDQGPPLSLTGDVHVWGRKRRPVP